MYNRYIPQPDGTYRRKRMQDPVRPIQQQPEPKPPVPITPPTPEPEIPPCTGCVHHTPARRQVTNRPPRPATSITGFLKQLLPKDFDIEDLLVILLLLLMSGDCQEDQNTALLTLVLYLFL